MKNIWFQHSTGIAVSLKLEINASITPEIDFNCSNIRRATNKAGDILNKAINRERQLQSPNFNLYKEENKNQILSLFPSYIYAEELFNQYDSENLQQPWFQVTTSIGHFLIGCRKRVISIDYTLTDAILDAEELFPDEKVTKYDKTIHAWSLEDAKRYINIILNSETI